MTILVQTLRTEPVARRRVELVERKGLGRPDTLCDAPVEAISLALSGLYRQWLGDAPGDAFGDVEPALSAMLDAELVRLPAFRAELVEGRHAVH